jgi:hypothetical protein
LFHLTDIPLRKSCIFNPLWDLPLKRPRLTQASYICVVLYSLEGIFFFCMFVPLLLQEFLGSAVMLVSQVGKSRLMFSAESLVGTL